MILSSHAEIRTRACGFYENLYKNELGTGWDTESVFFKGLTQVSDCANAELSGALYLGELHKALQGMNSGKVPGIDGLPVEFYKKNLTELGRTFCGCLMIVWAQVSCL